MIVVHGTAKRRFPVQAMDGRCRRKQRFLGKS
jgi:hypothetical protein